MNIHRYTRTVPYLYVNKFRQSFRVELDDKIIVRTKDNKVFSGIVTHIGTKYMYLRTSGITYIAQSIITCKWCDWDSEKILIEDIEKIAKYPEGSQQYPNSYLGRKSTNNYYFRQRG